MGSLVTLQLHAVALHDLVIRSVNQGLLQSRFSSTNRDTSPLGLLICVSVSDMEVQRKTRLTFLVKLLSYLVTPLVCTCLFIVFSHPGDANVHGVIPNGITVGIKQLAYFEGPVT